MLSCRQFVQCLLLSCDSYLLPSNIILPPLSLLLNSFSIPLSYRPQCASTVEKENEELREQCARLINKLGGTDSLEASFLQTEQRRLRQERSLKSLDRVSLTNIEFIDAFM